MVMTENDAGIAFNPYVSAIEAPPIAEARSWIRPEAARPLIDVTQAVPGYPPATELVAHLAEAVTETETAGYTEIEGIEPLRAALAEHMRGCYGGAVDAEQVLIAAGCNQAFFLTALALARPGDNILLPVPYYFNHRMSLDMLGIEARFLPCRAAAGLVPDPDEAASLIDGRTRAILLISPNNPTGAVYSETCIDDFFALAERRGIALVLDETYKDFLPVGRDRPHRLYDRADVWDTLVQLYSFSKAYCLPGYRVGAVLADRRVLTQIAKVMDCVSICAPHVGQRAALYGLTHLDAWRADKRALMNRRVETFLAALEDSASGFEPVSAGAYFAYLKHPFDGVKADDLARRLAADQALLCLPGTMFGPGQGSYLRFAFANVADAALADLTTRLAAFSEQNN
jgi:aspartate/methionine/tyrosine aminotransferase